jgi:hypothetical protein
MRVDGGSKPSGKPTSQPTSLQGAAACMLMLNILFSFDLLSVCQALGVQVVAAQFHSSVDAGEVALNHSGPSFLHSAFHVPFLFYRDGGTNALTEPKMLPFLSHRLLGDRRVSMSGSQAQFLGSGAGPPNHYTRSSV